MQPANNNMFEGGAMGLGETLHPIRRKRLDRANLRFPTLNNPGESLRALVENALQLPCQTKCKGRMLIKT